MAVFALVFVPETKNVPQESVKLLFEGDIIKGAIRDINPKRQRARQLRDVHLAGTTPGVSEASETGHKDSDTETQGMTVKSDIYV